jgi:CRP-like cAMP-binding protein
MFRKNSSETEKVFYLIRECQLFSGLDRGEIKELMRIAHVREYSSGETVFAEGTMGLCFYLVISGSVQIITNETGSTTVIRDYGKGAFFSEVHLFSETKHSVNCITKEISTLFILAKPDFEDMLKIKPSAGNKILASFLEFFSIQMDKLYRENKELVQKIRSLS